MASQRGGEIYELRGGGGPQRARRGGEHLVRVRVRIRVKARVGARVSACVPSSCSGACCGARSRMAATVSARRPDPKAAPGQG